MNLIGIKNLKFTYKESDREILRDISLDIKEGEIITLCGPSGCGKTTLLKCIKKLLRPAGKFSGEIYYKNHSIDEMDERSQAEKIGYVSQSADNQIVTDKVYHELAFGMESLGYDNQDMQVKVAEMASFFGIQGWFYKNVNELSGGQRQILTLASVMTLMPEIIILDEPTSQLDPIAAQEFINMLVKINRELGITILITEHRLDDIIPCSHRLVVMDEGKIIADNKPEKVFEELKLKNHSMMKSMPAQVKIWNEVEASKLAGSCPVSINDCKKWLGNYVMNIMKLNKLPCYLEEKSQKETNGMNETAVIQGKINEANDKVVLQGKINEANNKVVLQGKNLWFKYEKKGQDILKGVNINLKKGEIFSVLGANGTGKSTMLMALMGINKPYRGKVDFKGNKVSLLPQNPKALFVKKTVREELEDVVDKDKSPEKMKQLEILKDIFKLDMILEQNPYDLSGGEQQRLAIAKVMLTSPEVILMDEPTKGIDSSYKDQFGEMLKKLTSTGVSILMVSHDIEFCARWSTRCGMFFDGSLVSVQETRKFFKTNKFYTTVTNRIGRNIVENAILPEDIIDFCNGKTNRDNYNKTVDCSDEKKINADKTYTGKTVEKKVGNKSVKNKEIKSGKTAEKTQVINSVKTSEKKGYIYRIISYLILLLLVPATVYLGVAYFDNSKYLFISMLVMFQVITAFLLMYESREVSARMVVMISVLCALSVAGRMVFYMFPEFKPVVAMVAISGACLGGETGFLIGAMTMLVSNVVFTQGPWTPWQMFAMGIVGFLAGVVFYRGKTSYYNSFIKILFLCVYGFVASTLIYGGIMNPASLIMSHGKISKASLITVYASGIPVDIVRGIASVIFIFFLAGPISYQICRMTSKYDM